MALSSRDGMIISTFVLLASNARLPTVLASLRSRCIAWNPWQTPRGIQAASEVYRYCHHNSRAGHQYAGQL